MIINAHNVRKIKIDKFLKVTVCVKVNILKMLLTCYDIGVHFEDDPVQINELKNANLDINIVHLQHTLTVK